MAKTPDIKRVATGYDMARAINENFEEVVEAFRNVISRDGSLPNHMNADFDMNDNSILNVDTIDVKDLAIQGTSLKELLDAIVAAGEEAKEAADEANSTLESLQTFGQSDEEMMDVEVSPKVNMIFRLPKTFSPDQVAPINVLTFWRRVEGGTSEPYFTTKDGSVWVQTGYDDRKVLSTIYSAIVAIMQNPSVAGVQPFPSLAAFNAAVIPAAVTRVYVQSVGAFRRGASVGGIKAGWIPDGDATPAHFGAAGDGVADDGVAVRNAVRSGLPLEWQGKTYRSTVAISEDAPVVLWSGSGAKFVYDGPYVREAFKVTCGIGATHRVSNLEFDAGQKANVSAKFIAATGSGDAVDSWPSFVGDGLTASNAYRKDTSFADGDGLRVDGGFSLVDLSRSTAMNCFMAPGAEILGSQGIFGVTIAGIGNLYAKNVILNGTHVENVWSEDPSVKNDSDGIRIFQDLTDLTGSCSVTDTRIINVSNRSIKFHSGINATVDGIYRVLDADVIPQSGLFASQPDIDFQQAPGTVLNARFFYKGAWHSELIRNHTVQAGQYGTGGGVVAEVSGKFEGVTGTAPIVVGVSAASDVASTDHTVAVSDIAIDGPVDSFVSILTRGADGKNTVVLSNATAEVQGSVVRASGADSPLRVIASNIVNKTIAGTVPLSSGFTTSSLRKMSAFGYYGFSSTGAEFSFGGATGQILGGTLDLSDPISGRVGPSKVFGTIPSDAGVSDTDVVLLLQPADDPISNASGEVQIRRNSTTSALGYSLRILVAKDASSGDAAGLVVGEGLSSKTAQLVQCTFGGVSRVGVRISGGGASQALSAAYFTGNYRGTQPMRLVPASAVTDIVAMPQRANYDSKTTFSHPVQVNEVILPGGVLISSGSGSPEGVKTSPIGSQYLRTDGGAGTSMYVKESGTGNTGWVAK